MPDPLQEQDHREEAARLAELAKADWARPTAVLSQTAIETGKRPGNSDHVLRKWQC